MGSRFAQERMKRRLTGGPPRIKNQLLLREKGAWFFPDLFSALYCKPGSPWFVNLAHLGITSQKERRCQNCPKSK
jgi:hypothetical protein